MKDVRKTIKTFGKVVLPKWSSLNKIGQSKILRTSYVWIIVVPIIAKMLSSIENTVTMRIFGGQFSVTLSLPFSWSLFYYGAVSVSIANLIYVWKCPWLIATFDSFPDYRTSGRTFRQLAREYADSLRWQLLRDHPDTKRLVIKFLSEYGDARGVSEQSPGEGIIKHMIGQNEVDGSQFRAAFWSAHWHLNGLSLGWRAATAIFYFAGSLFIAWVIGQQFVYVWRQAF